jgi:hypothetical protein
MVDYAAQVSFPALGRRDVVVDFNGGALSSDGGLILLRRVEHMQGVVSGMAACVTDRRQASKVKQSVLDMMLQRVLGIAQGYEDCNDFDELRSDPLFKLAAGRAPVSGRDLASQPTLSRLENSVRRREVRRMEDVLVDTFIANRRNAPPAMIVLDADATDDPAHGQQELEFYHGYYRCHCFLPLLVFASADEGEQELVAAVLRPGNRHAGHRVVSIIKRVAQRLAAAFPSSRIVLRGDAALAVPPVYNYCEEAGLDYVISLPKNSRLLDLAEPNKQEAQELYATTQEKVRLFGEVQYAAGKWKRQRRVIVKAELTKKGYNPRFVVTSLQDLGPEQLYSFYTDRGDVENRIKELKCDLASGRTSCHGFVANQFRLLMHAAAFVLMQALRRLLASTAWANAQASTIRVRLLKVGALVTESVRRIWVRLPSSFPAQDAWRTLDPLLVT